MKKTNKLFVAMLMAGSFAMLFGSCKKQETSSEITVGIPEFQVEEQDRMYIDIADGYKFKWDANDEIAIYNLSAQNFTDSKRAIYQTNAAAEGTTAARFYLKDGEEELGEKLDHGYFVFYPAAKVESNPLGVENAQVFVVPATQTYKALSNGNPTVAPEGMGMACTLDEVGNSFKLDNIFGILRLKLRSHNNKSVTKIEVEDNQYFLSGSVSLKLHGVDVATLQQMLLKYASTEDPIHDQTFQNVFNSFKQATGYTTNGTSKVMTLDCSANPVQLNANSDQLFFIGLRPGALRYGFKFRVYTSATEFTEFDLSNLDPSVTIKPGVIQGLGTRWVD